MGSLAQIAVTSSLSPGQNTHACVDLMRYVRKLQDAGAQPIVIPKGDATARAFAENAHIRGVLFSGGGDVSAIKYGGNIKLCKGVDGERDAGEIALFRKAYFNNVPILAICRGMQLANVALGGSLIEDVPGHHNGAMGKDRFSCMHDIDLKEDSRIAAIATSNRAWVNSVHHQAIRELALNFVAVAHSHDGIIEAIEAESAHLGFFMGVQWHPEAFATDRLATAIFKVFVEACSY